MIHLRSFKLPDVLAKNPNIYPDRVFKPLAGEVLMFERITVLYGNNGSGKSSLLNIMASKLGLQGAERMTTYGSYSHVQGFLDSCSYQLGHDEREREFFELPKGSRYLKSEDILYEVKKIQQASILRDSLLYEQRNQGMSKEQTAEYEATYGFKRKLDNIQFSQEKYSNGETSMSFLEDHLQPGQLYLLDEPETSLSPANQIRIAEQINDLARYFDTQFIVATHSPFVLGTLHARIYNLDARPLQIAEWYELENVQYFYQFFNRHRSKFE